MMTLALLLTLCGDVTVTRSITIESDASIERLMVESAAELLPLAWDRMAGGAGLPGDFRPDVRDGWVDLPTWDAWDAWELSIGYGYTATLAGRVVQRSTAIARGHLVTSATLLSGLPQYCQSATLTLDARELSSHARQSVGPRSGDRSYVVRTRLVLTLTLRLDHPADWCRLVRRGMARQGTAEADAKLQSIAAAGRRAVGRGRSTLAEITSAFVAQQ